MSLRWERFAGDTSQFAIRLSLHDDPDGPRGADPDTSASWGAMEIWAGGVNLCAHTDQGETLKAAHWYLLPILEWLVDAWDPMLHEERLPLAQFVTAADFASDSTGASADLDVPGYWEREERKYDWDRRHSLRAASDGGLLPDLRIRRLRNKIELSWGRTVIPGALDLEWQAPTGYHYADPGLTATALYEVASEAAAQLARLRPESRRIRRLVSGFGDLQLPRRAESRTAWLAGLGATAKNALERWRVVVQHASEIASPAALEASFGRVGGNELVHIGSCQAALLFGSSSPTLTDEDAFELAKRLLGAYAEEPARSLVDFVRDEPLDTAAQPWAHGYDLAEDLLDSTDGTGLLSDTFTDIEGFLKNNGVSTQEIDLADSGIRAVSFASPHHSSTVLLNANWIGYSNASARRFTMAHELCHLLHDRTFGAQLAVASGPWAPRALEQRANAFAAMLLMPPILLRRIDSVLPLNELSPESLAKVAGGLRVPRVAVVDHLYNAGIIGDATRERLRLREE